MEQPEQKLIDIMFQIAFAAAEHMHGRSMEEIAAWVADQLRQCGFPTTPVGSSWGYLDKEYWNAQRATNSRSSSSTP